MDINRMMRVGTRGQSMVILVLVLVGVLIGFVALAVDGGSALLQRRNMQNGADAAALGAARALADSVVISNDEPAYAETNGNLQARIGILISRNRGGTVGAAHYLTRLEYGQFDADTRTYIWATAAISDTASGTGSWRPSAGAMYVLTHTVPITTDAVRITAEVDNPTTFARAIGWDSMKVSAVAAAALFGADASYRPPRRPTWPMTAPVASATPSANDGICSPVLFWTPQSVEGGNIKNILNLGARQASTYQGINRHRQLLTIPDTRQPLADTSGDGSPCGQSGWAGWWSARGNCTDPTDPASPDGEACCTTSMQHIDTPNYIVHTFTGKISVGTDADAATTWCDESGNCGNDWRSRDAIARAVQGDWLEIYNAGNLGQNIQGAINDYILAHGSADGLEPYYGLHVDLTMYFYDDKETWTLTRDPLCGTPGHLLCTDSEWEPAVGSDDIQRVHIQDAQLFRFYMNLASPGEVTRPPQCSNTPVAPNVRCQQDDPYRMCLNNSRVLGLFAGQDTEENHCPNPPCRHGLYNYVGVLDPDQ